MTANSDSGKCKSCSYVNPKESPVEFFFSLKRNYCKSCNTKFNSQRHANDTKIQLRNYNKLVGSVFVVLAGLIVYASVTSLLGFKFVVDISVFQVLIQVMAIFFGFQVLGIFYFLGKIDSQKRDFIEISGRFKESIERGVEQKEGAKDEALRGLSPMVEAALKKYDQFSGQLTTWIRITIHLYGTGISVALFTLVILPSDPINHVFLVFDVGILIIIFITFDGIWNQFRNSLKDMESNSMALHNFRLGYDKQITFKI
jgi:hypothetical protein